MHKRFSSFRGGLKQDNKFKCLIYASQETSTTVECLDTEINGQSLEVEVVKL